MKTAGLMLALLFAVGCRVAKVDNPVAPPPPPRISFDDGTPERLYASKNPDDSSGRVSINESGALRSAADEIPSYEEMEIDLKREQDLRMASGTVNDTASLPDLGEATGAVVLVNGEPIFAEDVLQDFAGNLAKAEAAVEAGQLPREEFLKFRAEVIRRQLPAHINSKLLANALKKSLKEEQKEQLKVGLQQSFDKEMESKQKQLGVKSRGELEVELAKHGWTMSRWRSAFEEQQMAQYYVLENAGTPPKYSRQELFDYYQEHQDEFAVTGKVKWRQIVIDFKKRGGEPNARKDMEQVKQQLIEGVAFAELAKEHSDGSTAYDGGLWDWTELGSLADEKLEALLFRLRPNTVSDVFRSGDSYQIVKVEERVDPGHLPFADVHNQIKKSLKDKAYKESARKLVEELKESAVIEPKFNMGEISLE